MSLLHTALKKAEREGAPEEGHRLMVDTEGAVKEGPNLRTILLASAVVASLLLFAVVRFSHRSSPPPIASAAVSTPLGIGAGPPAPELLRKASEFLADQRWGEAKGELEKAVILEPQNVEAYNNLGLSLRRMGQKDEALQQYQKALSLNPHCAECLNNLGVLYLQDRQFTEARDPLQKAIAERPDYADPYFHLALLAEAEGKAEEARRNYKKFMELAKGVDAQLLLAIQKRMASL